MADKGAGSGPRAPDTTIVTPRMAFAYLFVASFVLVGWVPSCRTSLQTVLTIQPQKLRCDCHVLLIVWMILRRRNHWRRLYWTIDYISTIVVRCFSLPSLEAGDRLHRLSAGVKGRPLQLSSTRLLCSLQVVAFCIGAQSAIIAVLSLGVTFVWPQAAQHTVHIPWFSGSKVLLETLPLVRSFVGQSQPTLRPTDLPQRNSNSRQSMRCSWLCV